MYPLGRLAALVLDVRRAPLEVGHHLVGKVAQGAFFRQAHLREQGQPDEQAQEVHCRHAALFRTGQDALRHLFRQSRL